MAGPYKWYFIILYMEVQWRECYEMVGTLNLYHMQMNLFELFALTGLAGSDPLVPESATVQH